MAVEIPDKSYFKIGEVSRIIGVEPYNIRYWESQFRSLRPAKTKSRQRLYRRKDVELLAQIKTLLYEEGYTINGARKRLKSLRQIPSTPPTANPQEGLAEDERRAYEEQLGNSQSEIFGLKTELETLKSELNTQRDAQNRQIEALENERQAQTETIEELTLAAKTIEGERANHADEDSAKLRRMELEREGLIRQIASLQSELSTAKASVGDELTELQTVIDNLQQENATLAEDLTTAQHNADADNELRAVVTQRDETIARLEDTVTQLQVRMRRLTEAVTTELTPLLQTVGVGIGP